MLQYRRLLAGRASVLTRDRLQANRMGVTVEEVVESDRDAWLAYVSRRDDATFVDDWAWRDVMEACYRLPCYWYVAKRQGKVEGVLALSFSAHPLLGRYLVTAPFGNYGGFYCDSDDAATALLGKAEALRGQLGARYVNIRHLHGGSPVPNGWQQDPAYATYWLELPQDPQVLLTEHLRSKTRWQVTQSMKQGFGIEFGGVELLPDFWRVITRAMKELGSPYHSRAYLAQILESFGERAQLAVVRSTDDQPVGVSCLLFHNDTAIQLHANFLRQSRGSYLGEFLYYSVLAECCRRGVRRFDMGRSLIGSGNEEFKMKWRPIRHELGYWYHLSGPGARLPALNQANPRLRWAIETWRRLPLPVHRLLGPRLITGIL
jgi:FemAB-related protein (PEP-CTERM system-associated)